MSPIDDELRTALHRRAVDVAPLAEPMRLVEARARRLHHHRIAAAAGSTTLAVAALAIALPLTLTGSPHPAGVAHHAPTLRQTTAPPTAPATAPAKRTVTPPATVRHAANPPAKAGDPTTWGFRGDARLRAAHESAATVAWAAATEALHTPTTPPTVLWATTDGRGDVVLVLVAPMTGSGLGRYEAGVWVRQPSGRAGVSGLHDLARTPGAISVKYDGSGATHWAAVVGGPGTGQVEYAADGHSFRPVPMQGDSALFRRTVNPPVGQPQDLVRVLNGDGDPAHPLYRGAIGRGFTFPDA